MEMNILNFIVVITDVVLVLDNSIFSFIILFDGSV